MARKSSKTPAPLRLEGALDIQNAATLHATLSDRFTTTTADFALDLAGVTACDSAGLQLLCATRKSVLSAAREWRLTNPPETVLAACADFGLNPDEIL